MPTFEVVRGRLADAEVDAIAVAAVASPDLDPKRISAPPPAPTLGAGADELAAATGIDFDAELAALRFDGSVGAVARIPTRGTIAAPLLIVVGVGKADGIDADRVRRAGAALADATARLRSLAVTAGGGLLDGAVAAQALTEGLLLNAYRFGTYKSDDNGHQLDRVEVHPRGGARPAAIRKALDVAQAHAGAATAVRDLVNEPPVSKRPPALAERVKAAVKGSGVKVRVLEEGSLAKGGYGGLLAVGQGSDAPPRLVELTYDPPRARRHVALVGKGITFDSGGLSIKTGAGMMTMKCDMSGAATVFATIKAAAELGLKVKITALLALAENMPSASAQRPGDIFTARNGKTVEVLNTAAEGRLVLADALAHASEAEPDAIVDVATLTGAMVVALGTKVGGLIANDDPLADALLEAGERAGEPFWRLPLADQYREDINSDVADIKNIGAQGVAGSIVAALFLEEFVADGIPWAHLDVAGVAWSDSAYGYVRKGGTGVPARTLLTWLAQPRRAAA